MKKTVICVLMALVAVFVISCSGDGSQDNTKTEGETKDIGSETATEGRIPDGLPERDYENREFTIIAVDPGDVGENPQVTVEEENGDTINDAVYHRNLAVEERYNMRFAAKYVKWLEVPDHLRRAVNAGDDAYDLAFLMEHQVGNVVTSGLLRRWNDLAYVDFDKPWWQKEANKAFNFGDTIYITAGDMSTSIFFYSCAMYFNKKLAADYHIENLYDVVRNRKWTIDYLGAVTKDIYKDLNGNQPYENMYGFALTCANEVDAFLCASNLAIVEQKDGNLTFGLNNERMATLVGKLVELCNRQNTYCNKDIWNVSRDELFRMFASDRLLVTPGNFITLINNTRDMVSDYGILPYPMLDETQGGYYSEPATLLATLVIPASVKDDDMERVGIIAEALNREAYYRVRPAFYDVALKVKTSRDEDSEEMIDIILAGRRYDMGSAFADQFSNIAFILRNLVSENKTDFVSRFEKLENAGNKALEKIKNNYLELR